MHPSTSKYKIYLYLFFFISISSIYNFQFLNYFQHKFLLKKIHIEGLNELEKKIIENELDKFKNTNIFKLTQNEIFDQLNQFNFIENINASIILPSTINVNLSKTLILGKTTINGKTFYIGGNGKLIRFINLYENSSNGTNSIKIISPESLSGDLTLTLPSNGGNILSSGDTSSITNDMLTGSIANSKLSNSAVTVTAGNGLSGGGSVSLGGTVSLAVGVDDSSIEINSDALRVKASGITNAMLAGSIANSKLSNSAVTVGSTSLSLGSTSTTLSGLTDVTIDGSGGLKIKNGSTSAGFMEIYENSFRAKRLRLECCT